VNAAWFLPPFIPEENLGAQTAHPHFKGQMSGYHAKAKNTRYFDNILLKSLHSLCTGSHDSF